MDITYWLDDSKEENKGKWNQQHLIKLLSEKNKENLFDLREYSYLIQTIKNNNTLINSKLFSDLIQKIDSDEIKKQINILYPHIYDEYGFTDLDKIVSNFIEIKKQNNFSPTVDQYTAVNKLINFMSDYNKFMFGLYGYAGTGKTTIMTEIIHYLLSHKLISSVAFTAPTNKAVDVCKTKFMNSINDLYYTIFKNNQLNITFDEMLDELAHYGIKIDFITIHRLLNYKTEFDISGDKMFIKQSKNLLGDYQLIIIDECSMIQLELISNIFDEVYHDINNYNKPKIIFSGDTAQLPPVNELNSSIFIKKHYDITEKDFIKAFPLEIQEQMVLDIENIKKKIDILTKRILTVECVILKQIVRNNNEIVNNLCHEIRKWIDKEIKVPEFGKFVDKDVVYAYKKPTDKGKTESKWFKTFIMELREGKNNIILAWTNKHCDMYNMMARQIIFKDKEVINEYEIGDILILSEFYNLEMKDKCERFHTSEQIYVHYVEPDIYMRPSINDELSKTAMKMKNINHIEQIYKKTIIQLNKVISERYLIWKLYVYRLSDVKQKDTIPENYILKVIQSSSINLWNANKNICIEIIRKFRQTLKNDFKSQISNIDKNIVKPLWKELNRVIIEPFANVNYGFAITTHKSQGSTYHNIFVDIDDILDNKNDNEAKRCLYTSLTRASNKIHMLL
jgi:hypothetical protein